MVGQRSCWHHVLVVWFFFFFFKQKTAYEMRISDWSSDVCSSDLFWSIDNRERLRGAAWIKTCGGLYAFLAARRRRAPLWMQHAGLEWAFRAAQEPSRLGWRYLMTNPHAMWRMLVDSEALTPRPAGGWPLPMHNDEIGRAHV